MGKQSLLRSLPSVDSILNAQMLRDLTGTVPRTLILQSVRAVLAAIRAKIQSGDMPMEGELSADAIAAKAYSRVLAISAPSLRRVVNATGIIVHTGLGRAVLPESAQRAICDIASGYCNLEIDTSTGSRGSRATHYQELLASLCNTESALAVNNNAAAVLLALNTLAAGKEVIVSRGELVEIGGTFRMPDIMARAGARLVEVGTTNRTRISDYEQALSEETALIMRVHSSNFRMIGFTESPSLSDIVNLAKRHKVLVMHDLGSGSLIDLSQFGLKGEPIVDQSVKAGVDIVTFSGDKLLGGPQAGLIVGRSDLIAQMQRNPLARALRVSKVVIAALEATLKLYLNPETLISSIPTLAYIARPLPQIEQQARRLRRRLIKCLPSDVKVELLRGFSEVGGGALPGEQLPTRLVALSADSAGPMEIARRFRNADPPVFGRVGEERFLLDMRTVQEEEIKQIEHAAVQVLAS